MIERRLEIVNRLGLHARAAAKLVHVAGRFSSDITVSHDGQEVDAKSILGILMLAAAQGATVRVRCAGSDEKQAMEAVRRLIEGGFDENGRPVEKGSAS